MDIVHLQEGRGAFTRLPVTTGAAADMCVGGGHCLPTLEVQKSVQWLVHGTDDLPDRRRDSVVQGLWASLIIFGFEEQVELQSLL